MNKTININLGGIFFHIDEEAYQKLKKYLEAIRRSLSDDPQGKDEIITDIESRIGEILSEKIKDVRQVVNENDIEEIIEVMGRPEEYVGDDEIFNDDTTYKSSKNKKTKKLFRDGSDKFLGGVASGLAHYFGVDVIWVRLGWLLLLIGGFSVVLYPILWILLPEANTTSEKLEMEGEPVNISNIERKIKEELSNASKLVKDGIEDVSEHLKSGNYQSKVRTGLQEIIDLFARVFSAIFKVTGKFIGIILIVMSAATLLGILVGGFSLGSIEFLGMGEDLANYPPFFNNSRLPLWLLVTFGFIVFAIPFVLLFMLGLKIISSNVKSFSRPTNLSFLGIWLMSLMGLAFAGIEYQAHDANQFTKVDKITINIQRTDTLNIKMLAKDSFELKRYYDSQTIIENDVEKFYRTNISLDVRESNTDNIYLKIQKKAYAITKPKAKKHANNMVYNFDTIKNNLLLNAYFISEIENIYRHQKIKMVLYIPKGQTIYLDRTTKNFLDDVDNVQDIYDKEMIRHYYKMTENGLNCLDCKSKNNNEMVIEKSKNEELLEDIKENND